MTNSAAYRERVATAEPACTLLSLGVAVLVLLRRGVLGHERLLEHGHVLGDEDVGMAVLRRAAVADQNLAPEVAELGLEAAVRKEVFLELREALQAVAVSADGEGIRPGRRRVPELRAPSTKVDVVLGQIALPALQPLGRADRASSTESGRSSW